MLKSVLVFAVFLALLPAWGQDSVQQVLEDSVPALMRESHIKGLSLVVVHHYEVVFTGTYGVTSGAPGAPSVTPDTLFQAASMSKPVASYGMLLLVARGLTDLDKPVNDQLTGPWRLPDPDGLTAGHPVTLDMLMRHTGGTTVHGYGGYRVGQKPPTLVQLLDGKGAPPVVVDRVPGTAWAYSGGGFEVMQLLMVQVSGERFPDYMQSHVLQPLGMSHSTFETLPESRWAEAAGGSSITRQPPWNAFAPACAAASLWTTPSDYAKFVLALARGGGPGYPLDAVWTTKMLTGLRMPQAGGGSASWGLGVGAAYAKAPGIIRFHHDGNNDGFTATFEAFTNGDGVVVMANQSHVNGACYSIQHSIERTLNFPRY